MGFSRWWETGTTGRDRMVGTAKRKGRRQDLLGFGKQEKGWDEMRSLNKWAGGGIKGDGK